MRGTLARFGSWGRKALVLGALLGVPALAAAPAAHAEPRHAVMVVEGGVPAQLVPVQYGYGPPRGYYRGGPRHWHRPPPPRYYRRHYAGRGYGPPPRYYRHPRPYGYR